MAKKTEGKRYDKQGRVLQPNEYQGKDGRYIYHYVDIDGKRCKAYSWCLNNTDKPPKKKNGERYKCDKCLREIEDEIKKNKNNGINSRNASKRILDEQFEIFYKKKKTQIKKNTLNNYKYTYEKFIQPRFGKRKISTILYSDIEDFYSDLVTKQKFKIATLDNIHTVLNPLFKGAIKDRVITMNPCEGILADYKKEKKQIGKSTIRHSLSVDQEESLIAFVKANKDKYERWYFLLVFFIRTGCRVSEMCGLTWDDINFKTNLITIDHQLDYSTDDNGKFKKHIETPKSEAGYRTIPLLPEVKTVLLEEWQRQKKNNIKCLDTLSGVKVIDKDNNTAKCTLTGFVFLNRFGNCLLPHSTNKAFERIRKSYNEHEKQMAKKEHREPKEIDHFSNHYLRHTFCVRLCEATNDIAVIKSVMGHSDIQTTMNIYNEVHDEHKQDVFSTIADKMKIG